MLELNGKVAIVTGGNKGIGGAIAVGLASAGADVLVVSRTEPQVAIIAGLQQSGRKYAHCAADLSTMNSIAPVIESAITQFGRIDILVNNAGIIRRASFLDYTEADWDAVVNLDLKVPVFLAQACAHRMVEQRTGGKIINICSLLSHQGGIRVVAYTAAKHALAGVTRAMANELAPHKINVNGIAPGYIRTDTTLALQNDPIRYSAILDRIPQQRWGEPADLTGAAVFLAGPGSDYVNGHILDVDGGWMAR
jgi:2-deoxy-D-gluconate 3-dehydrogenase